VTLLTSKTESKFAFFEKIGPPPISEHHSNEGFADSRRFSSGFEGRLTSRQAMSVANVRFYRSGNMFWDERANSLEDQALAAELPRI